MAITPKMKVSYDVKHTINRLQYLRGSSLHCLILQEVITLEINELING